MEHLMKSGTFTVNLVIKLDKWQYSRSVDGASDEVRDIYCEPCYKAGQVAIADGYCVDCPEYLCGPCCNIHRRLKTLANHVLLDKDSMPLANDSSRRLVDICEEKCSIHPNKVIELFCETCDKVVCHICVATDHRQCEKVKHIPDIVKDLENTKELKNLNERIKSIARALSEYEKILTANVTSNNDMRRLAKQELNRLRAEVNTFFDQLEKKIDDQITTIEKRNQDILKAASDRMDHIKTDIDEIKNDIEAKNTGQRCGLFIGIKRSEEKMKTFQEQFRKLRRELRIQRYTLVPSEQIEAMMRTTTEICRIATASFKSKIDIKTSTDKTEPEIRSLTTMHGHYCVLLDFNNKSIKVIDTNNRCVTSEITIKAENIWSVMSLSDDQVAVSVSLSDDVGQMQFFTVSGSGVIQRTKQLYDVDCVYSDLVHCAGNIYGVCYNRIDKLSMTGKIIRTIHKDDTGGMAGIAASPDGHTLYVTDNWNELVTSMTLEGKVKAVYKEINIPRSITVDKHGYVYVCSRGSFNIQQFTGDLNKVQDIIENVDSNEITYSSTENKLFLSTRNQTHLYSFDFNR